MGTSTRISLRKGRLEGEPWVLGQVRRQTTARDPRLSGQVERTALADIKCSKPIYASSQTLHKGIGVDCRRQQRAALEALLVRVVGSSSASSKK